MITYIPTSRAEQIEALLPLAERIAFVAGAPGQYRAGILNTYRGEGATAGEAIRGAVDRLLDATAPTSAGFRLAELLLSMPTLRRWVTAVEELADVLESVTGVEHG